ncbi:hypothetical protein CH330_01850 [candidate division WOR-3 bacterium JGI_Cruoil_03_51_56]|uniref:Uncharacterized protein n=1 Tax=candidate division WOR-3 bacterium JGI_Cruoil_03_51_56 TaxID=1973747 RepID=A0A235BX67_UNCW3|nr:MAG: hypothetical protein CH330_01850 [candidate division WOR-3 bacterium JGI_Cruoil_03_51_56]
MLSAAGRTMEDMARLSRILALEGFAAFAGLKTPYQYPALQFPSRQTPLQPTDSIRTQPICRTEHVGHQISVSISVLGWVPSPDSKEKGFHFCKRIGNLVRRQEENPAVRLQTKQEIRHVANQPIKRKDKRQLKPIE